jgi:DNA invertase Pin-like site-specific DNA recombinase
MERANFRTHRCAVYTRKSSEEGLDQHFNSLDAQREACAAFIKSQASAGWTLVKTSYDDGGMSGGTMERPALQQLLADIGAGLVNIIVVYKVDRLTRSLADFAKMVELFDSRGVSFVAVTQQFNTTTSMGRLTLNVLLSFAQFEREVTGERIRDKIAASKRKGLWMGGVPPLGYDLQAHRLVVNPGEAATVRDIYQRYLELGSVRQLSLDLAQREIVSKVRVSHQGLKSGGCGFSRGALYQLLANPIYLGEIRHRQERYPGQHQAIVPRELWQAVQQRLRAKARRGGRVITRATTSPLTGKLFDAQGEPLYAQGAAKGGRRYRYYVSRGLINRSVRDNGHGWRLPVPELERAVALALQELLNDRPALLEELSRLQLAVPSVRPLLESTAALCQQIATEGLTGAAEHLDRVELCNDGLRVRIRLQIADMQTGVPISHPLILSRFVKLTMKRRGVEARLILAAGNEPPRKVDAVLLKALARARAWFAELASGQAPSLAAIARREGLTKRYVERMARLAFAAPWFVEAVGQGPTRRAYRRTAPQPSRPAA